MRCQTSPLSASTSFDSAGGPPVEEPMTSTPGFSVENWRSLIGAPAAPPGPGLCSFRGGRTRGGAPGKTGPAQAPGAERAHFRDQFAAEILGGGNTGVGFRLGNVVGRAQRQRLEGDLGIAARERRCHQHRDAGTLLEQQRQRREPVHLRHFDVEDDDVGLVLGDVLDGDLAIAEAADEFDALFLLDPSLDHAANDDGVIDDTDADAPGICSGLGRGRRDNVHGSGNCPWGAPTGRPPGLGDWLRRARRPEAAWLRRSPCRTAS